MRTIIFYETSAIGTRAAGHAARSLGYEPCFVCDFRQLQADTLKQVKEFNHIDMPTDNVETVGAALAGRSEIRAVCNLSWRFAKEAIDLAQLFDVAGPDLALRDFNPTRVTDSFVQGERMSLEGYVREGAIFPLGITNWRTFGLTDTMAAFPEDHRLRPGGYRTVVGSVRDALKRQGIRSAYFHAKFLNDGNNEIMGNLEVGAIGDAGVGELLALSYEIDPVKVYSHFIATTLSLHCDNPYLVRARHASSIAYGLPMTATLLEIADLKGLSGFHTQVSNLGQRLPAMGENNRSWVGIATGYSQSLTTELRRLRLRTDRGDFAPCY